MQPLNPIPLRPRRGDAPQCDCGQTAVWTVHIVVPRNRRPVAYHLCDRCLQLEIQLRRDLPPNTDRA